MLAATLRRQIGGELTEIGYVSLKDYQAQFLIIEQVTISVINSGTEALAAFRVNTRAHRNGTWIPTYTQDSDWTAPSGNIKILVSAGETTASPFNLAAGASMTFDMYQLRSTEGLMFEAQTAGPATTVIVEVGSDT